MSTIKISEHKLKKIIVESIRNVLKKNKFVFDIDVTKIPINILKQGYFDYRLVPTSKLYGNVLLEPCTVKEAVGDIMPVDDVIKNIINKYNFPQQLIIKKEHFHKIYVYVVTAMIGINDKLITEDMEKLGYFLAIKGNITKIENMRFQVLQFEPTSQLQEDITDTVKSNYNVLYHWTPLYRLQDIINNGLIPRSENNTFTYPPRIYLIEGDSTDEQRIYLGRLLCAVNKNPQNNGKYALLSINIKNLNNEVRFYYDPNSEIGIYTEQPISPKHITVLEKTQLKYP